MEKVRSVRVLSSRAINDETNLLLVCRDVIILTSDHLLSIRSIVIMITHMTVGTEYTPLVLRSMIHNIDDELTNPVYNPFLYKIYGPVSLQLLFILFQHPSG